MRLDYAILACIVFATAGCAATPRDPACGGDWGSLTVGMSESTMVQCSFYGYHPYVDEQRTDGDGTIKIYRGMGQVRYVAVKNGRVMSWQK